jgi:hypothetical protein
MTTIRRIVDANNLFERLLILRQKPSRHLSPVMAQPLR